MKTFNFDSSARTGASRPRRWQVQLAVTTVLFAGGHACEAANSTVVTAQDLWTGKTLYTADINPVDLSSCGKQTVGAPEEIVVNNATYEFLFWDINATPYTTQQVKFQPICGAANGAIAIYWPVGGGPCPEPCPPPTTDDVIAYSLNDHAIIAGKTPIGSASGGWVPGSTVVTPPTTIEALPEISGFGRFKGWEVLGGIPPASIDTNPSLTLKGAGQVVVGFFGFPDPDPCQPIRNEINNPGVCDGLTGEQCSLLMKNLNLQLQMCKKTYGE